MSDLAEPLKEFSKPHWAELAPRLAIRAKMDIDDLNRIVEQSLRG